MLGRGAGVLWTAAEDRVAGQIVVSPALVKEGVKAGAIARALGEKLGVRGGGKDGSAQVGGKLDLPLERVVEQTFAVLETLLAGGH
jgi:alanyl-tRNA synthetase